MIARGPTHARTAAAYLAASRRARASLAILGTIALVAVFADVIASAAPLLRWGDRVELFPGLVGEDGRGSDHEPSSAVFAPVRADPTALGPEVLAPPQRGHALGTDERGRDVLARLVHGARIALGTSVLAIALSLVLGLAFGALAGSGSTRWNRRLARFVEAVDTFPAIVAVALIRAIETEPSAWSMAAGVALVKWAEIARVVRAEVLRLSLEDFVLASRALGASRFRTLFYHVLPHTVGPVAVCAALGVGSVTLLESAVTFLGLGPASDHPSWGELLAQAARHPDRPWLLAAPTLAIGLTVGAAFLLADALRDATDPRAVRLREAPGRRPT
ncbi:MAG: ABC transporter permease [Myxococcales bacterium]|nr:ABC transporter permease [Myxococcales bacterium]